MRPIAAISMAWLAMAGCAHSRDPAPLKVRVSGHDGDACTIEVNGRKISSEEFMVFARQGRRDHATAHVEMEGQQVPYRCIGGAISILQAVGFDKVSFVPEPKN